MNRFVRYHRIVRVEYVNHRIYPECLSMVMCLWVKAKTHKNPHHIDRSRLEQYLIEFSAHNFSILDEWS